MGTYNVRLNGFTEQDKDILDVLDQLNSHHKLTEFITRLIRAYFDGTDFKGNIVDDRTKALDAVGCYYNREKFFREVENSINAMQDRVDKVYDMAYQNYLLSLAGKKVGLLEEKSENSLTATFVLEKQLRDLRKSLGVSEGQFVHASSRLDDIEKRAESVMEQLINTYGELVNELKVMCTTEKSVVPPKVVVETVEKVVEPVKTVTENVKKETVKQVENKEAEVVSADEPIDFGDADMGALSKFLGF